MNFIEKYIEDNKLLLEGITVTSALVALFMPLTESVGAKLFTALVLFLLIFLILFLAAKTVNVEQYNFVSIFSLFIFLFASSSLMSLLWELYAVGVYGLFWCIFLSFFFNAPWLIEPHDKVLVNKLKKTLKPLEQRRSFLSRILYFLVYLVISTLLFCLSSIIAFSLPYMIFTNVNDWFEEILHCNDCSGFTVRSLLIFVGISFVLVFILRYSTVQRFNKSSEKLRLCRE